MGLVITHSLTIPESELRLTAVRSGGPGGQNVNKLSTCVILEFDLRGTACLNQRQKDRIAAFLGHRVNRHGMIRVKAQRHRTQSANRQEVIEKFVDLLRQAFRPRKDRIPTNMPDRVREKRIVEKKQRAQVKRARKPVTHDQE